MKKLFLDFSIVQFMSDIVTKFQVKILTESMLKLSLYFGHHLVSNFSRKYRYFKRITCKWHDYIVCNVTTKRETHFNPILDGSRTIFTPKILKGASIRLFFLRFNLGSCLPHAFLKPNLAILIFGIYKINRFLPF